MVKTRSCISTCLVWESESDESGSEAVALCLLGEVDHGDGGYFGGLGIPDWACWKWVLWDHHRYDPAFFRFEVSHQLLCPECKLMDSTVQFVGITAFHTQIADPLIGGTYMTVSHLESPLVTS